MKRFLILIALFVFSALSIGADSIRAPRGFAGKLYAGTLALYGTLGSQTQFVCTTEPYEKTKDGYRLLSAGHCVQDVPSGVTFSIADSIGGKLTPVAIVKVYEGKGIDFAIFDVKTAAKYPLFVLGDEHGARVGDRILNPNFAVGVIKQLSIGVISSTTVQVSPKCSVDECAGDFIVQMYGGGGASGSAVISEKTHKVIGIVVWGFSREPIGFGIEPISRFATFLAGPNQPHPAEIEEIDAP